VSELSFAEELNSMAARHKKQVNVHIKIDTGMHRSGAAEEAALELFHAIDKLSNIKIDGIFSHFASSEADSEFCLLQEQRFNAFLSQLPYLPRYVHLDNSNGVVNHFGTKCNLVRLGILAYGVDTSGKALPLKPVMTFKACLSQVKAIKQGESVGYNRTWIAKQDGSYAIIPIGYADGYDFLLSNSGVVMLSSSHQDCVSNYSCKVIGRQIGRRARRHYYLNGKMLHSSPLSRRDFVPDDFNDSKLNQIIESAISQRLQSAEIGELIYREILRSFFYNKDRDIHYRYNFHHQISFSDSVFDGYYAVDTELSFDKVLQNDYFIVACAASDEVLQRYLKRSDVEYRWLMDDAFNLDGESFLVSSVMLDELELTAEISHKANCLEIRCSHPELKHMVGKMAHFTVNTKTLYPKASHQLSVFITELTKGVFISFKYLSDMKRVECVPVFSGQDKFPKIEHQDSRIDVCSKPEEWIFPISGIVFSY
jgi:alanine racemase